MQVPECMDLFLICSQNQRNNNKNVDARCYESFGGTVYKGEFTLLIAFELKILVTRLADPVRFSLAQMR